jgi:hypothetical protein
MLAVLLAENGDEEGLLKQGFDSISGAVTNNEIASKRKERLRQTGQLGSAEGGEGDKKKQRHRGTRGQRGLELGGEILWRKIYSRDSSAS